jgi:peptide/nickel transport system substrate-binding protein
MEPKKITRRDFIKTSGKVAAGAALTTSALTMLPKTAWAKKNNVIVGMTQEPVNFNPLLYVNSGTEIGRASCRERV